MRVLLLHAYSSSNAGDGLLVHEALDLISAAFPNANVDVAAQHPETFDLTDARVLDAGFSRRGPGRDLGRLLREMDSYDLLVGVGGGYLRAGTPREALQTSLAHLPQLVAAGRSTTPTVYLPQSVGPFRGGTGRLFHRALTRLDHLLLRDDRSMREGSLTHARRSPDLALLAPRTLRTGVTPEGPPVLSVRQVRGGLPAGIHELAQRLGPFDGYVQSRGAGNDDLEAVNSLHPLRMISADELFSPASPRRVVVSVRLHGAIMALNAGHRAIHLSYERKGFGAFQDLGLAPFVHNVHNFDPALVTAQVRALLTESDDAFRSYDEALVRATDALSGHRDDLIDCLRNAVS